MNIFADLGLIIKKTWKDYENLLVFHKTGLQSSVIKPNQSGRSGQLR